MGRYHWWQSGIIYHIYPLSFMDSNGDGRGDLRGIIEKLEYLQWLGVQAIWLSPVFASPMKDFGYDIVDYCAIDPVFGTMADMDRLIEECHRRHLKIILDYVPNHTSDQHPWFIQSRSARSGPKRDWYLWRDPAPNGGPPNNWLSAFGGSAWEWDEKTEQYYYHAFLEQQPDLNWRNPEVRREMLDVMRFWLDRGVDGFRVDVMWHLIKDDQFRDNPPNPDFHEWMVSYNRLLPAFSTNQPEVHDVVAAMRTVTDAYDDRVLIGEIYLPISEVVNYYGGEQTPGAHLPSNFQLVLLPWNAEEIYAGVGTYEASIPAWGWPNWVLSNHDRPRVASRVGAEHVKAAALLLLMLKGTPTIYYGDEIGMKDLDSSDDLVLDPAEQKRDAQRSPMQWDGSASAGFTQGKPWLPVGEDHAAVNVETGKTNPASVLSFYLSLIALRQSEAALTLGNYEPVAVEGSILAFVRRDTQTNRGFLISANLGHAAASLVIPGEFDLRGNIVLDTELRRVHEPMAEKISLRPGEGIIALLES